MVSDGGMVGLRHGERKLLVFDRAHAGVGSKLHSVQLQRALGSKVK
jgi:hypothetical protein